MLQYPIGLILRSIAPTLFTQAVSKRLWLVLVILIVVGLGVAFALPRTHFAMLGWLRGEAYYAGQPASYWAAAIQKDPFVGSPGDVGRSLREGGPAALPVLGQLVKNDDDNVRTQALLALSLIEDDCHELRQVLLECLKTEDNLGRFQLAAIPIARLPRQEAEAIWMEVIRENPTDEIRSRAANSLGSVGSKDTLPVLRKLLDDPSPQVRVAAASAIWQLDRQEGMTLPVIMRLSGDRYGNRGQMIASEISFRSKRALMPGLVAALKDEDPITRQQAVRTIGWFGPDASAAQGLLSLKHDSTEIWKSALEALGRTPKLSITNEGVQILVEALADKDPGIRWGAAMALRFAQDQARSAGPALGAMLQYAAEPRFREMAAIALGEIRTQSPEAVNALAHSVQHDESLSVRFLAARAIEKIGSPARSAAGSLVAALKENQVAQMSRSGDPAALRSAAAQALGAIGPEGGVIPALDAALKGDPASNVRASAARSLGKMGRSAVQTIGTLTAALNDDDPLIRTAAAEALLRIDPRNTKAIPTLTALLKNPQSAWAAASALEALGPAAKGAVSALIDAAKENPGFRSVMFQALGSIGSDGKDAVPMLVLELKNPAPTSSFATSAPTSSFATRAPADQTRDPGMYRTNAARALWQITHKSELALPALVELSKDKSQVVRKSVAQGLGQMGPVALSALPVVRELLEDNDWEVREAAAAALRQIDPNAPTPPK
jgi:HEAT repeat protein